MAIKDFLGNIFKRKIEKTIAVDPETIKRDEIVKALTQQLRSREAQLGKLLSEKKEEQELIKLKDKDQILIAKLKNQERELKDKSLGNAVSFTSLFSDLSKNKNLRGKIEIVDKEGKEVIGIFGDIISTEPDTLALLDIHRNIIVRGKQLSHIIYKPESLINYIKTRQIRVPYMRNDNDGTLNYMMDMENLEFPDIVYNERDRTFDLTEEKTDKVKNILIKKTNEIRKLRGDLERVETINIDLKNELDDITRVKKLKELEADSAQSELSKALGKIMQIEAKTHDTYRMNSALTEQKANYELLLKGLEGINEELRNKMEQTGSKSEFEKTLNTVQDLIDWAHDKLPETIVQNIEAEKKVNPPVQPGQPLRK